MAWFKTEEQKLQEKINKLQEKKMERENKERLRNTFEMLKKDDKPEPKKEKKEKTTEKKEATPDDKVKPYSHMDKAGWLDRMKNRFAPQRTFLIRMELRNGFHIDFVINTKQDNFKYEGGVYIIDSSLKYYSISSSLWCLDYHQDFSFPIKRQLNIDEVKRTAKKEIQLDNAINPATIEEFMESKVAQAVMQAASIDEFFKNMKLIIIVNLVITAIHFILFVVASKILSNIKLPF